VVGCVGGPFEELPTTAATHGDLVIRLAVPSELEATDSVTICAPDLGNNIKLTPTLMRQPRASLTAVRRHDRRLAAL
jgi:hypothetical protein